MKRIKVWITKNEQNTVDAHGRKILGFACLEFENSIQIHTIPFVNIGRRDLEISVVLPLHLSVDEELMPAVTFSTSDFEKRVCKAIKYAYTKNLKDAFDTDADYRGLEN